MEAYMNPMTRYLLAQSWQIAILAVLVGVISLALRHRSAHVRYLLWLIVLAKCLVPPIYSVPLAVLPDRVPVEHLPQVVLPEIAEQRDTDSEPAAAYAPVPIDPVEEVRTPRMSTPATANPTEIIVLIWLAGLALFLLWVGGRAIRYTSWLRGRRTAIPPDLEQAFRELLTGLNLKKMPRIWLVKDIGQPFVWGVFNGSIYLPDNFADRKDPHQCRTILAHELSHVVRFDAGVNLLQLLAQAVYWFHPLVWWINKKIRVEREKCCDEMAVARLSMAPEHYTGAIVEALAQERQSIHPIPSLAIVGSVRDIEERIKTMMRPGRQFYKRPSIIVAMAVLSLALLTVPTALVLTSRAETEASAQQEEKAAVNAQGDETLPLLEAVETGDLERVKVLIEQGADVMARNEKGATPLHRAARRGHRDVVKFLLEHGADINAQDNKGKTPLYLSATWGGYKDMVKFLLERGADVSILDNDGWNVLHTAAEAGQWEILVMLMAEGLRPETGVAENASPSTAIGSTTLHLAVRYNQIAAVKTLLATGMNVNIRNEKEQTPLYIAVLLRRSGVRLLECLLDAGAEVNVKTKNGNTPLHVAAPSQFEIVEWLINHGADVNAKNESGRIPLHGAPEFGAQGLDKVNLLIRHGSKVDVKDKEGWTPLHQAAGNGSIDIVQRLIASGAEINAQSTDGRKPMDEALKMTSIDDEEDLGLLEVADLLLKAGTTPSSIHLAAYAGDIERVREFIAKGVDVNGKNVLELTPLHTAALGGHKQMVTLLIAKGADLNAEAFQHKTPLHYAAWGGHAGIAALLLSHGAKVHGVEGNMTKTYRAAMTPLQQAAFHSRTKVIEVLLDHGADVNMKGGNGRTPLADAMWGGADQQVTELLMSRGADINSGVLYYAAYCDRHDFVKLLIAKGANVNAQFPQRGWIMTPLHTAANHGHVKTVKTLLAAGAKLDVQCIRGMTPLQHAMVADDDKHNETLKLLIAGGADINEQSTDTGQTPLHEAAGSDRRKIAETLLAAGAKVNIKDKMGRTALAVARQYAYTEIAEMLLEHGAKELGAGKK
jgi:ankyrin repeat protein/beta-lactamase regulating signal transducer with metallopeptidase domain